MEHDIVKYIHKLGDCQSRANIGMTETNKLEFLYPQLVLTMAKTPVKLKITTMSQKDYSEHTSTKITTEWHHNSVTAKVNTKPKTSTAW